MLILICYHFGFQYSAIMIIFSKSNYDQMNKTNKFYRVGPHVLRICGIPPMDSAILLPEFAPFILTDEDGEETEQVIEIDIRPGKVCIAEDEDNFSHAVSFEWEDCRCRICQQADGDYQIGIAPVGNPENEACAVCSRRFHHNIIFLPQSLQQIASFIVNNFLMMIYTFATAGQGTLMIHASVIHYNGKGYLFLGKSGTGKSTHSSLWLKYIEGSRLLNDDNPVLAVDPKTGQITVYGTPWSGKTACYLNESVPVGSIVRLEQAPHNVIKRLDAIQSFAALLPSCSCLKQDTLIYKGVIDTVTHIVTRIPVYSLKCLPDEAAAHLSMETVTQTEIRRS